MRVLDNVYLISGLSNCYIVERDNYCILIDTSSSRRAKKVIRAIKSYCPDKPLAAVIITHAHFDHTAGLEAIGILFGPEIIVHHIESAYMMKTERLPIRDNIGGKIIDMFMHLLSPPQYTIDRVVSGIEVIYDFKVFHTPGHTLGSIALLDRKTRVLFVGDAVNVNKKGDKILRPSKLYSYDY
ncbi:MAG: MBL fold metallo-hydrolase, partial [Candidatus Heimdallarchaeaceae archaeon]